MRFMLLVIPKGYETAAPGTVPEADAVARMMKFNEEMQKAGILISLDGLHPPSMGTRVYHTPGKPTVVKDGPFTESKEVLGGYWIIQVKSRAEAVEWARRAPMPEESIIEVRQVQEMSDFPPDVKQAAAGFEQMQKKAASGR
jgi:hypothetical protein